MSPHSGSAAETIEPYQKKKKKRRIIKFFIYIPRTFCLDILKCLSQPIESFNCLLHSTVYFIPYIIAYNSPCIIELEKGGSKAPIRLLRRERFCFSLHYIQESWTRLSVKGDTISSIKSSF